MIKHEWNHKRIPITGVKDCPYTRKEDTKYICNYSPHYNYRKYPEQCIQFFTTDSCEFRRKGFIDITNCHLCPYHLVRDAPQAEWQSFTEFIRKKPPQYDPTLLDHQCKIKPEIPLRYIMYIPKECPLEDIPGTPIIWDEP
jgi:hypothetical protein